MFGAFNFVLKASAASLLRWFVWKQCSPLPTPVQITQNFPSFFCLPKICFLPFILKRMHLSLNDSPCLFLLWYLVMLFRSYGFPGGLDVKAYACNAGDLGSIPGSRRSPGEGNGNPLQYSFLENPMDGGAWWAAVHAVPKNRTQLREQFFMQTVHLSFYTHTHTHTRLIWHQWKSGINMSQECLSN